MRKLIYYVAVTVDGVIADPDGRVDAFLIEGDHMPWIVEHYPETVPGHLRGPLGLTEVPPRAFDTVLMGRATHQVAVDERLSSGYPHLRQYVFTHRQDDLPSGDGLTFCDEDPVALVRRLKAEDSPLDIWLSGGGVLAGQLIDEIDEFRLKVNPILLGGGIPVVAGAEPAGAESAGATTAGPIPVALRQRSRRDFESGVSYVEYARA